MEPRNVSSELDLIRFRAAAAIYGGTFLIGNEWDYRQACLVLAVPLLGGWLRQGEASLCRRALGSFTGTASLSSTPLGNTCPRPE